MHSHLNVKFIIWSQFFHLYRKESVIVTRKIIIIIIIIIITKTKK